MANVYYRWGGLEPDGLSASSWSSCVDLAYVQNALQGLAGKGFTQLYWGLQDHMALVMNREDHEVNFARATRLGTVFGGTTPAPGPRKPVPKLPAEVWSTKPYSPDLGWQAIIALSSGQ